MSDWSALHALRIGCVQYLNSKPLIHGYDGEVVLAHPSELARELAAGRLDAALVPAFEFLREPHYALVDDVAIASDGPVHSVVLGFRGELRDIRRVALDPASLTSANLLRVLLREFHGLRPETFGEPFGPETFDELKSSPLTAEGLKSSPFGAEGDAQLLIGNQAIEFRERADAGLHFLDLGEEWKRCTGLPFVYAAWAVRLGVGDPRAIGDAFRALKANGLRHLDEIIATDSTSTPAFRHRYLTSHIRFDLREREKAGLARYRELLRKNELIGDDSTPLVFV